MSNDKKTGTKVRRGSQHKQEWWAVLRKDLQHGGDFWDHDALMWPVEGLPPLLSDPEATVMRLEVRCSPLCDAAFRVMETEHVHLVRDYGGYWEQHTAVWSSVRKAMSDGMEPARYAFLSGLLRGMLASLPVAVVANLPELGGAR